MEKVNLPVAMDTDSRGETDKQGETTLLDDDGEDDYSEGEIYRFADTSGMPGNEDEPGNSWYIETLKGRFFAVECCLSYAMHAFHIYIYH